MRRLVGRKRSQSFETVDFGLAVNPGTFAVEDNEHPPVRGKGKAAEDRRRPPAGAATAVDENASLRESANADARSDTPSKNAGKLLRTALDPVQSRSGGAEGQRQLGARAQPRMRRDHRLDVDPKVWVEAEVMAQRLEIPSASRRFGAADFKTMARANADPGVGLFQGDTDTREAASQASFQIEETEVQPRRRRDG